MALFGWLTGKKKKTSRAKPHPADAMDSVMYEAGVEFGAVPERKPVAPNTQDAVLSAAEQAIEQRGPCRLVEAQHAGGFGDPQAIGGKTAQ